MNERKDGRDRVEPTEIGKQIWGEGGEWELDRGWMEQTVKPLGTYRCSACVDTPIWSAGEGLG